MPCEIIQKLLCRRNVNCKKLFEVGFYHRGAAGGASRLADYDETIVFDDLVWSIPGHRGPLEHHYSPRLPLADQFRRLHKHTHQSHDIFDKTVRPQLYPCDQSQNQHS